MRGKACAYHTQCLSPRFACVQHTLRASTKRVRVSGTITLDSNLRAHWSSFDLTCKRGSVGQSEGLSIPRSSVRFRLKLDNSNSHEFELHRPSNKGTKLLLKVIKAIIIIISHMYIYMYTHMYITHVYLHV